MARFEVPKEPAAGAPLNDAVEQYSAAGRLGRSDEETLLQGGHVVVTGTGLSCPPGLTYGDWERAGAKLRAVADTSAWCLGDWLIYGQTQFSDRYRIAVEKAAMDYQTMRNYAWVARRFPLARRRPELSFQHHAELASLDAQDQDRWLERAIHGRWSRNRLRSELRARRNNRAAAENAHRTPALRVSPETVEGWRKAAADVGLCLQEWIVATLDHAAPPPA